jgi:hypothetical protein
MRASAVASRGVVERIADRRRRRRIGTRWK